MQQNEDNESGYELLLDGFSADWSACDMSIGTSGNEVVVSGYCKTTAKTSLDFVHKNYSGSWSSWMTTREFDREGSNLQRFVSFIGTHRIVTCCGNVIEVLNCDTYETEMKLPLSPGSVATCVAVRNQDVYVGFKNSASVVVLTRNFQDKMTITLTDVGAMWPIDVAVIRGKLLVCLKNSCSYTAVLFTEKEGKRLVEYRNALDGRRNPASVAIDEESDLLGILWSTDPEDYDWQHRGHISLHSATHGYCLSVFPVAFRPYCYSGANSPKIRLTPTQVAVMEGHGDVTLVDMKEVLSEKNVTWTLSNVLFSKKCKGFQSLPEDEEEDNTENESLAYDEKIRRLNDILGILAYKRFLNSECVKKLRRKFSGYEGSQHEVSRSEVLPDRKVLPFGRLQQYEGCFGHDVNISFASSDMFAVSHFCDSSRSNFIYVYRWDCNNQSQSILHFYRRFDKSGSVPLVSLLHEHKAVTCCGDLIETVTFTSYAEVATSHKLSAPANCLATRDGKVYLGFLSSEIMIFDSNSGHLTTLKVLAENITRIKDLAVLPGKLFVCTGDHSCRALLLNEDDGSKVMEYNNIAYQVHSSVDNEKYVPGSITASENNDLVAVLWYEKNGYVTEDDDNIGNCWNGGCHKHIYSLSKGSCLGIVENHDAKVIRFFRGNLLATLSQKGKIECMQMSYNGYENIMKFYGIKEQEIVEKEDGQRSVYVKTRRVKCLLDILDERTIIKPGNVSCIKDASTSLCKVFTEKLYQPVEAYLKYSVKSSNQAALSVLELHSLLGSGSVSDRVTDQLLSQQPSASSAPGPSNRSSSVSGKRVCNDSQELNREGNGEHGGKRKRIRDSDYTDISLTPLSSSTLQLLQGDVSLRSASVSTPSESLPLVTGSPVLQSLEPKDTTPLLNGTELAHRFHGASSVMSTTPGHQRESQSMLDHSSQQRDIVLLSPLLPQQPVESHHSGSCARVYPPNQGWQIEHLQAGQQGMFSIGPNDAQQVLSNRMAHVPRTRRQAILPHTPQHPIQLSHSLPTHSTYSKPTVPAQLSYSMPPQHAHSMLPQVTQSSQPLSMLLSFRQPAPAQVRQSPHPLQYKQPVPPHVRQPSQPLQFGQPVPPPVGQSAQPQFVQAVGFLTEPQMIPQVTQNEQRDPSQRCDTDGAFQQVINSSALMAQQGENATGLLNVVQAENKVGQPLLRPRQMESNLGRKTADTEVQIPVYSEPGTHQNTHHTAQFTDVNNPSQDSSDTELGQGQQDDRTTERGLVQGVSLLNTECDSFPQTSRSASEGIVATVESCVHRVVTPLLKDISDKFRSLLGSSKTVYLEQDIPGTSSQSDSDVSGSAEHACHSPDSEPDAEVNSAWESLSEYNRMSLQAFRGMTDDRAELVRRLVEIVFTEEERLIRHCFGKSGKQKLDETKLTKIRYITFYLCPIITKKPDNDKLSLEDAEWKRLCEVVDKANRHFREKLKRQGRKR